MIDYNAPAPEGSKCYVNMLRLEFIKRGLPPEQVDAAMQQNAGIRDAVGRHPEVQRFLINQFLTLQLLHPLVASRSLDQRYQLLPTGDLDTWERILRNSVIPWMAAEQLPQAIAG